MNDYHNQLLKFLDLVSYLVSYAPLPALFIPRPFSALFTPRPVKRNPNKLAPNVPNNILRNPAFCSFTSFYTVSVTTFNNKPEFSRDFTILIMS